jgi:hypothetical protein
LSGEVDCGAGAFEVPAFIIRLVGAVVVVGDEPYAGIHDRIDLVAVLAICGGSDSVAMDYLAACGVREVEAIALGASERGVLRIAFDVSAVDDLNPFVRRTDGILLLLEVGHILLNAGASSKRDDCNYQKSEPHNVSSPADLPIISCARSHFFCGRDSSSRYELFFLRSAQRFFIAIDRRFLPSGVRPPRLRFFIVVPLGLPTRFFLRPPDKAALADPSRAVMARPSLSRSLAKSATIFSRSKGFSFGALAVCSPRLL